MKNIYVLNRVVIMACTAAMFLLGNASYSRADDVIGLVMDNWHSSDISGTIMCVDTNPDSIVVNEVRIFLADATRGGKRCVTKVVDIYGRETGRNALRSGKVVYVKVGGAMDLEKDVEYVVAKEIYLLPRGMSRKELINKGIPTGPTTPW